MTLSNQKSFNSILSVAQNMIRSAAYHSQSAVTPEMIETELLKLESMMPQDFALIDRNALVDELIRRSSRTVGDNATLSSDEDHVPWLNAKRKENWKYWQRYSEHMEERIPWTALDALDVATDEILSQLEDPTRKGAWDRRGLVVGHVQSGKTGNYTGLICKAADAGYKIIIVLAGLHNNLRSQTQIRLDEGFLGFATIADASELPAVGVGLIDRDISIRPRAFFIFIESLSVLKINRVAQDASNAITAWDGPSTCRSLICERIIMKNALMLQPIEVTMATSTRLLPQK